MIKITQIPASTATSQLLLVEVEETLCKRVCLNEGQILSGTISFSTSTATIVNGVAIVPITATGEIVLSGGCENGCVKHFAEKFIVPFVATGTNTATLTEGISNIVEFSNVKLCHTNKAKLSTTLTVAIA